jgi:hypothetical protein
VHSKRPLKLPVFVCLGVAAFQFHCAHIDEVRQDRVISSHPVAAPPTFLGSEVEGKLEVRAGVLDVHVHRVSYCAAGTAEHLVLERQTRRKASYSNSTLGIAGGAVAAAYLGVFATTDPCSSSTIICGRDAGLILVTGIVAATLLGSAAIDSIRAKDETEIVDIAIPDRTQRAPCDRFPVRRAEVLPDVGDASKIELDETGEARVPMSMWPSAKHLRLVHSNQVLHEIRVP